MAKKTQKHRSRKRTAGAYVVPSRQTSASDYGPVADAVQASSKTTIWTSAAVLFLALIAILGYRYWRSEREESQGYERFIGNVGGQGTYQEFQREGSKKQLACYSDLDCPDETRCQKGICIPRIHQLPPSMHINKMGLGRKGEKSYAQ